MTTAEGGYHLNGRDHAVVTRLDGDIRIAFVSCNGEENGDLDRESAERNLMWARLEADHRRAPFALLLQGGDQIYADEATHGHPLTQDWPDHVPEDPSPDDLDDLTLYLQRKFAERYMMVLAAEGCANLLASVPSLSVWDDHDICDGWGSLPESRTASAVGQALFRVARQMYLLFQHGATEADVPALFTDPTGSALGWRRDLPGATLFAPDLRSERHRHRIMGEAGWKAMDALQPMGDHVFMVSSVPLLGPRLSLLESAMMMIPGCSITRTTFATSGKATRIATNGGGCWALSCGCARRPPLPCCRARSTWPRGPRWGRMTAWSTSSSPRASRTALRPRPMRGCWGCSQAWAMRRSRAIRSASSRCQGRSTAMSLNGTT
ncbi:alkaline phosphatase D family protein [Paracoccus aerius]